MANGNPIERFFKFVPITSHTGHSLCEVIKSTLCGDMGIGFEDNRMQTFDNASNMAGKYSGVQARVLKINDKEVFIPCMAHSLNLSDTAAAESSTKAVTFLGVVQKYMFSCHHPHIDGNYNVMSWIHIKNLLRPNDSVIHHGQFELMPLITWQIILRLTRKYCRHSKMIHYRRKTHNMKQIILEKQWAS